MKNKFNPQLLKEEIKRFKLLSEWAFNVDEETYSPIEQKDILYGALEEADEAPDPISPPPPDDSEVDAGAPPPDMGADADADAGAPPPDMGADAGGPPADMVEPESDDIEVDVTDLIKGNKKTEHSAHAANKHTIMLLQKFKELEARVGEMDKVTRKIEDLEQEIIKRNPTPVEKLEMRSLSSYPYSQKLTDYWADKEGPYDVMNTEKKKEYILNKDAIDSDYSDINIQKSFSVKPNDNEYEEEDI